ncbi:Alpha/Beta hydrolase protein [Scheffersomyces coipomensis]|uniref:Alpha/Beta hydrolase protein n=1 Tax=Scheffersomyces coipomensis TaxID=1788519 RepID=UPI00315C8B61
MTAKLLISRRLISSSNVNSDSNTTFDVSSLLNQINFIRNRQHQKKSSSSHQLPSSIIATGSKKISKFKRSTHPTSVPLVKLLFTAGFFPLSIKESLDDYAFRKQPLKFQQELLNLLPFYPNPDTNGKTSSIVQTVIDDKGNFINEFVVYPPGKSEADSHTMNHIVLVHGYGGGLGFFLKNFDGLSNLDNWCVHGIDLLGYGCSSRPPFKLKEESLDHVEDFFHESFEIWLNKRGLSNLAPNAKLLVVGHSMGAYLMATYGIRNNPNFCDRLLMLSPGAIIKHRKPVSVPKYFEKLWEQNISPFTLVRQLGPFGSKIVSGWSSRRFANLSPEENKCLHRYAYGIFSSPGSGEYMLNYLLAPGANARHPLIERGIHKLKCKVSWWYGSEDWMDIKGGQLCSEIINNYAKDSEKSRVFEFEDSGHHLYLENTDKFHTKMLEEMKSMESEVKEDKHI